MHRGEPRIKCSLAAALGPCGRRFVLRGLCHPDPWPHPMPEPSGRGGIHTAHTRHSESEKLFIHLSFSLLRNVTDSDWEVPDPRSLVCARTLASVKTKRPLVLPTRDTFSDQWQKRRGLRAEETEVGHPRAWCSAAVSLGERATGKDTCANALPEPCVT